MTIFCFHKHFTQVIWVLDISWLCFVLFMAVGVVTNRWRFIATHLGFSVGIQQWLLFQKQVKYYPNILFCAVEYSVLIINIKMFLLPIKTILLMILFATYSEFSSIIVTFLTCILLSVTSYFEWRSLLEFKRDQIC